MPSDYTFLPKRKERVKALTGSGSLNISVSTMPATFTGRFAGQPVNLMKWQTEIIRELLGTLDRKGQRKYRRLFIHIARKNGKTFLACLLIIYWLAEESFSDPSAEVVSCAVTREQIDPGDF